MDPHCAGPRFLPLHSQPSAVRVSAMASRSHVRSLAHLARDWGASTSYRRVAFQATRPYGGLTTVTSPLTAVIKSTCSRRSLQSYSLSSEAVLLHEHPVAPEHPGGPHRRPELHWFARSILVSCLIVILKLPVSHLSVSCSFLELPLRLLVILIHCCCDASTDLRAQRSPLRLTITAPTPLILSTR